MGCVPNVIKFKVFNLIFCHIIAKYYWVVMYPFVVHIHSICTAGSCNSTCFSRFCQVRCKHCLKKEIFFPWSTIMVGSYKIHVWCSNLIVVLLVRKLLLLVVLHLSQSVLKNASYTRRRSHLSTSLAVKLAGIISFPLQRKLKICVTPQF